MKPSVEKAVIGREKISFLFCRWQDTWGADSQNKRMQILCIQLGPRLRSEPHQNKTKDRRPIIWRKSGDDNRETAEECTNTVRGPTMKSSVHTRRSKNFKLQHAYMRTARKPFRRAERERRTIKEWLNRSWYGAKSQLIKRNGWRLLRIKPTPGIVWWNLSFEQEIISKCGWTNKLS